MTEANTELTQRKHSRVDLHAHVEVDLATPSQPAPAAEPSAPLSADSLNISEGGMCIRSEKPFDAGIFILADFSLPSEKPIRVISRIIWSRASDSGGYDSGMEFWYIEDEDRHYLGKYIEQEMNAAVDKA